MSNENKLMDYDTFTHPAGWSKDTKLGNKPISQVSDYALYMAGDADFEAVRAEWLRRYPFPQPADGRKGWAVVMDGLCAPNTNTGD